MNEFPDRHLFRFYDEEGKPLYDLTIIEPKDEMESLLRNKKIELTIEHGCEVSYEERDNV